MPAFAHTVFPKALWNKLVGPTHDATRNRRAFRFVLLIVAISAFAFFKKTAPREQTLHFRGAEDLRELEVCYAEKTSAEDCTTSAVFRFPEGSPHLVTHEPKLADGEYTIKLDVTTATGAHRSLVRSVDLGGKPVKIALDSAPP